MPDNKNVIVAILLSIVILLGFELYNMKRTPAPEATKQTETQVTQAKPPAGVQAPAPVAPGTQTTPQALAPGGAAGFPPREHLLATTPRVKINTPRLHGSVSLAGGRLDDLTLADYRETVDRKSPEIVLLIPKGGRTAYFAEFGWVGAGGQTLVLPGPDTVWRGDRATLAPDEPLNLTWDNGQGLVFHRTIAIDRNYMFTVTDRVENKGKEAVTLHPYGLVSRRTTPVITGFYILHEGLLGVFNGTLSEVGYSELQDKGKIEHKTTGGWIGITDKYWLAALVPNQQATVSARFLHTKDQNEDRFQVDVLGGVVTVAPGASASTEMQVFAGAKEVKLFDGYEAQFGIKGFDRAIDFGWFYFLTKPIFLALLYLHEFLGNMGTSILLLTVFIKLVFFPLANKSYVAMSKMKKLQPEMTKLRERFGEDKVKMNQELMTLYKREKANPAAGCLPIVIQIPVFFALYKVLFVTIEMRHAPFFGWIKDLSAPDPTTLFNLFGLIPWTPPEFLLIGVWPLIMGVTMFLQQKLNPQPADPIQAKMFMLMPIFFTALLAQFSAGLVIYWAWNNLLSILQQWVIMRRMGVKV